MKCSYCHSEITSQEAVDYSTEKIGPLLCDDCTWYFIPYREGYTSMETILLFVALKAKGISVELEKFDGYKKVDIVITKARLNIEVDGIHHVANARQAWIDKRREYYSLINGYDTMRIPNIVIQENLEKAVELVVDRYKLRLDHFLSGGNTQALKPSLTHPSIINFK